MLNKLFKAYYIFLYVGVFLISCSDSPEEPTDTTTRGEVNIHIDESFSSLFEIQKYTFEHFYKNATLNIHQYPQAELVEQLFQDSCKVIAMGRDITAEERHKFESNNIFPISTPIAHDAIVLITNKEESLVQLSLQQIKTMLTAQDSIHQESLITNINKFQVVFDNNKSANALFIKDSLINGKGFSDNVFALTSNQEVISYISKHKNTIGFISLSSISDKDDPKTKAILDQVNIIAVAKDNISKAYKPSQSSMESGDYAFGRTIFMINRQTRAGLGMGFVSFVSGEKGQLMILKSGLVPTFHPERPIKINTK